MTNPKLAQATDNGRFYLDPKTGELLISVTNVLDKGVGLKGPALQGWAVKVTVDYVWEHLPQLVKASRVPAARDDMSREIKAARDVVRDKASDLGSRVHALAEAHLTGRAMPDDEEAAPYVGQYEQFLSDFEVDITADIHSAEVSVFNREQGYAGTLDVLAYLHMFQDPETHRVTRTEDKHLWLIDLKSSQTKPDSAVYPDQTLQLAGLRYARGMWLPDDSEMPMPPIHACATLNLRTGAYGFIPHVVGLAEKLAFQGALAVAKWGTTKRDIPKPVAASGEPKRPARKRAAKKEAA
jgi:hypothetical protein